MKKFIIIITTLLAVGAIIYFVFRPKGNNKASYQTYIVKRGDITEEVTATGSIEPVGQVEVGTQVSGTISRIYVDYNSEVTKGQLLAELDRTVLEAELKSQNATLQSNKNEYEYQQKNYKRIKGLHNQKLVSDTEMETAEYELERSRQAYQKSESDLVRTRTNLSYAYIYSPIDGVVLSRAVDEGQTVAASFNTPTLFTIANDLSKMQVIAKVDETDIGQVEVGQRVMFEVSAFRGEQFEGSVTQVRLNPTTESNVVTYEVVIDAPNPDLKLKPGLTADVWIYTLYKKNVLMVPKGALLFQPDIYAGIIKGEIRNAAKADQPLVWVPQEGGVASVNVQTGISNKTFTEVVSGLKEGEPVITGVRVGMTEQQQQNGETNPFMPPRPGGRR